MNPLLVDPRTGSRELFPLLCTNGCPVKMSSSELLAGDFCFEGNGPDDARYLIGVERKTIRDMLSSINTGRFSGHQLPLLTQMYDRYYLVIEGVYGCGNDGILEEPRGGKWMPLELKGRRFMHSMIERFLISVEESTGIRVHKTSNPQDTARHVIHLWHVWNDKSYNKHKAGHGRSDTHVEIRPWSVKRRIANDLPGIGQDKSAAVDKHFATIEEMMNATAKQWAEIPGIGKGIAERIVREIKGS